MRLRVDRIIMAFVVLIVLLFNILLAVYMLNMRKMDNKSTAVEIVINDGDYIDKVLDNLVENKLIRSKFFSKVYIKLNKYNFQAGIYDLNTSMSATEIIKTIANGNVTKKYNVNLTFKEGKNIIWYAKYIANNTNNTEEDVYNLLKDTEYIDGLIDKYWFLTNDIKNKDIYYPLEGYLYPETYTFNNKDVTVKEIFAAMLNQTNKVLTSYKEDIEKKNLNIHKFMTLASVVELEGIYTDDRREIAGVLYNRINNGWSLGCDATTYYAFKVDMGDGLLTYQQYNTYNPYNTRYPSVLYPVGPIGNPSKTSIEACINPIESDNFFYVADCKTGKSVFTKNEYEHVQAVNRIHASGCQF